MIDMQKYLNDLSAKGQKERSNTQLTLGELMVFLRTKPDDFTIIGLGEMHSYRGYYSDLSFEPQGNTTAKKLLAVCVNALSQEFTGYKGGEFYMNKSTPLWVASYGSCGTRLMGINPDGSIDTSLEE